jgi:hypothetical protein
MASEYRCSHCGITAASCEAYIAGDSDRRILQNWPSLSKAN